MSLLGVFVLTILTAIVAGVAIRECGLPSILIGAGLAICFYCAIQGWASLMDRR